MLGVYTKELSESSPSVVEIGVDAVRHVCAGTETGVDVSSLSAEYYAVNGELVYAGNTATMVVASEGVVSLYSCAVDEGVCESCPVVIDAGAVVIGCHDVIPSLSGGASVCSVTCAVSVGVGVVMMSCGVIVSLGC